MVNTKKVNLLLIVMLVFVAASPLVFLCNFNKTYADEVALAEDYTITLNATFGFFDDGQVTKQITLPFNTQIVEPKQPIRLDYVFDGWYKEENCNEDNFQGEKYVFDVMPAESFTLYARWVKQTVQISIHAYTETSSGTFAHSTGGGSVGFTTECGFQTHTKNVNVNESATFFAKVNKGYKLSGVYLKFENNQFLGEPLTQNFNGNYYIISTDIITGENVEFYAKFTKTTFTVTLLQEGDLTVAGSGTYNEGDVVTISCTESLEDNYKFFKWVQIKDNLTETFITDNLSYSFTITKSVTFLAKCKIKLDDIESENGKIKFYVDGSITTERYFAKDTELTIEASPNYGYNFVGYKDYFAGNPRQFTIIVTIPQTVEAIFESKLTTIQINTNDYEHISFEDTTIVENFTFKIGDIIILNAVATPSDYYVFEKWQTNAVGVFDKNLSSQTYKVEPGDVEKGSIYFKAIIKRDKVDAEVVVYGGGQVRVNGLLTASSFDDKVKYNTNLTIDFLPNKMFEFGQILLKNKLEDEYTDVTHLVTGETFETVTSEHIFIEVYFKPQLWIDVMKLPNGKGIPDDPYLITCPEEFAYISFAINNGLHDTNQPYYRSYIKIVNDINFSGRFWTPIGVDEDGKRFDGILDINYCDLNSINLLETNDYSYGGLFDVIGSGKIIRQSRSIWLYIGSAGTVLFGGSLIILIVILKVRKRKRKKVVVLPTDVINTKK